MAAPRTLPVWMPRMNLGMSIAVGHASTQGASKQNRQRDASTTAAFFDKGGVRSVNAAA